MNTVTESFGSLVFDDRAMKARLTGEVYRAMKQTMKKGQPLNPKVADAVASAMDPFHPLVPAAQRRDGGEA